MSRRLLNLKDGKAEFGLSYWTLYSWIQKGLLTPVRLPGHRRIYIDRADLDRLIDQSKGTEAA